MNLPNATILRAKLDLYLEGDAVFRSVYEYTRRRFDAATNLTAHNFEHIYRDTLNAIVIGEAEDADMSVVLPAMVMHDIGFLYGATGSTHGAVGAERLVEYLQEGGIRLEAELQRHIADCIRTHKGSAHDERPETLEAKVVSDADMLDKFGPVGIYQVTRVFTEFNRSALSTFAAFDNDKRSFQTPTGNKLVEPMRDFNKQYVAQLRKAHESYLREDS